MSDLPTITDIRDSPSHPDSPLSKAISILFESSPILISTLEPQLASLIATALPLSSYSQLIDASLAIIRSWDTSSQSKFIAGHPRIGENKNLSNLSAKEQGSTSTVAPTPPEVLSRLEHLNAVYEAKYPGLRYITFVNGRSRAAIAEEMEDKLGFEHSLSSDEDKISSVEPIEWGGVEWKAELDRAVVEIGRIAKSRLLLLGVE